MGVNVRELVGQTVGLFVIVVLALFVPAGTVFWLAGWVFVAMFFGFFIGVNMWLYRHNPGLLRERMRFGTSDQQGWDKIVFPVISLFPLVWLIFIAFDAVRFHWSPVPVWLQVIGGLLVVGSFYLFFTTFRENSYLSPIVRVQKDRGHQVITTGPYHYVRHPMYTGFLVFVLGVPLLLGAWYGMLVGLLLIVMLARRAVLEEHLLRDNLHGYTEYAAQVRYRFVPYLW